MANEYPIEVRREARRLWLTGRFNYDEIAAKLKIPRADTIRDWRRAGGWGPLANDIAEVVRNETKAAIERERGAFKNKYDQIGQAIELRAVRGLSNPNLPPRDLKALAGTIAIAQKIREKALGIGSDQEKREQFDGTLAGLMDGQSWEEEDHRDRLGRCRPGGEGPEIDDDPPEDAPVPPAEV